jgi:hypothetical protein
MISPEVMQELMTVRQVLHYLPASPSTEKGWTPHEQHLFWAALTKYPQGPWTAIADYIGTKSTRQAMTHAQKLRQKFKRWNKRLRRNPAARAIMDGAMAAPAPMGADATVPIATNIAVTTDVAIESSNFLAEQQAKDAVYMSASSNAYYSMGNPGGISLGDFTVVSESKVEGDHDHSHDHQQQHLMQQQQQYAHQLGYVLGGYAAIHGGEHLSSDGHMAPPSYPLAGSNLDGGQYHLPAVATTLPPLHPMPASMEAVSPRLQPLMQSPHTSPLMSRAMMDDLVHMLMAVDDEEEEEEEEEEELDEDLGGEDD